MSLLDDEFKTCTFIHKVTIPDGYGGYAVEWHDGAQFEAVITFADSLQAREAAQAGVNNLYTVYTRKDTPLDFHEVFRREEDGKIFRVTNDGKENATPRSAGLNLRRQSAEQWTLPT